MHTFAGTVLNTPVVDEAANKRWCKAMRGSIYCFAVFVVVWLKNTTGWQALVTVSRVSFADNDMNTLRSATE